MNFDLSYKPYGNSAILIEWEAKIGKPILDDILSFRNKIISNSSINFQDLIVGYHSLTIKYTNPYKSILNEIEQLCNI